jgi:hypothetical protein
MELAKPLATAGAARGPILTGKGRDGITVRREKKAEQSRDDKGGHAMMQAHLNRLLK